MEDLLLQFINDPYNDVNNFELGYCYENIGQTASARHIICVVLNLQMIKN